MTASLANKNLWRIIGAKPGSTTTQLKSAYRHLMRHAHTGFWRSQRSGHTDQSGVEALEDEARGSCVLADRKQWPTKLVQFCAQSAVKPIESAAANSLDRMVCAVTAKHRIELNLQQASSWQTKALQIATEEFRSGIWRELIIDKVRSAIEVKAR